MTNHDLLDPSALLSLLPSLLPADGQKLNTASDAIAALFHTILTILDFRLVSVEDDGQPATFEGNVLPLTWNAHGPGSYTLVYKHNQSSLEFVVKVSKLASRTLVNAIATETHKIARFDFATADFTSPSFFPWDSSSGQPLVHGFISSSRVADLASSFRVQIVQNLLPGLRKEGYQESESSATIAPATAGPARTQQPPARQPQAPQNEPFYPSRPFQPPPIPAPGTNPLEIGRRDRDPFPAAINPFAPPPLFGPDTGSEGMFVGPDHPIFGGGGRGRGQGQAGPWGGDGFLPPLGAPPGARFDPIGPGPMGLPGRGRGGRFPGGPPGSGEPDNDEFMPPGAGDMFM